MSYSEENGQVVLTMSREDYEKLLMCLGVATGLALRRQISLTAETLIGLTNRLNQGNPNYTPYEVKA